jgi:hypothetical protein
VLAQGCPIDASFDLIFVIFHFLQCAPHYNHKQLKPYDVCGYLDDIGGMLEACAHVPLRSAIYLGRLFLAKAEVALATTSSGYVVQRSQQINQTSHGVPHIMETRLSKLNGRVVYPPAMAHRNPILYAGHRLRILWLGRCLCCTCM